MTRVSLKVLCMKHDNNVETSNVLLISLDPSFLHEPTHATIRASWGSHENVPFNICVSPLSCFLFERVGLFFSGNRRRWWEPWHKQYHLLADQWPRTVSAYMYTVLGLCVKVVTHLFYLLNDTCFKRASSYKARNGSVGQNICLNARSICISNFLPFSSF